MNFEYPMTKYDPPTIEPKWQRVWEEKGIYRAEDFSSKKKFYLLVEFPYPSGDGLHVGHARSYAALDAVARKKRMEGYNVLFPFGWDAFGLPTENYALKTGVHPQVATQQNIVNFKKQAQSLGLSFDWTREISTTDPAYYKWTQWIFLQLFKKGLAYQAEIPINWCPSCKIGLANEEVVEGRCERCGTGVGKIVRKQWMLKITAYAERLIADLKKVNYPSKVKLAQINWIGKSEGTTIKFQVQNSKSEEGEIEVFTTRPDTLAGVTALILAPEHPLVSQITTSEYHNKVSKYIEESRKKSELERIEVGKIKSGVFTGAKAINPLTGELIPIWVADYILLSYGTGAIMLVPAHDQRDFEFAKAYDLEIREVISGGEIQKKAYLGEGVMVNSGQFSGLSSKEGGEKITQWLAKNKRGKKAVNYKLRDWVFSRQHYWGEPIPIVHCQKCGAVPVPEKDLPVTLPYIEKYQPTGTGESPLVKATSWLYTKCPKCGGKAQRETDTMPNWAGSSWYFMRYCDPTSDKVIADPQKLKYWLPVDWYNGGFEHTTLHLLYSRFWYKFLYDLGVVPTDEPYTRRTSHGIVLAEDGRKMSKSLGNVVRPEEIIKRYGADTLRLYEMFLGPFDQAVSWNTRGMLGVYRFLERLWRLVLACQSQEKSSQGILRALNRLNKKIAGDLEAIKFNTAVAAFMEFVNLAWARKKEVGKETLRTLLLLLAPFAPHLAEELWYHLDPKSYTLDPKFSIHTQDWPKYEDGQTREEKTTVVICVNGRLRDKLEIQQSKAQNQKMIESLAFQSPKVKKYLQQQKVAKTVFIPGKLINFVI